MCENPILEHGTYGRCSTCGRYRAHGTTSTRLQIAKLLQTVPRGGRDPEVMRRVAQIARVEELLDAEGKLHRWGYDRGGGGG